MILLSGFLAHMQLLLWSYNIEVPAHVMKPMLKALRAILHTPTHSTHLIKEKKAVHATITTCIRAYLFFSSFFKFLDARLEHIILS